MFAPVIRECTPHIYLSAMPQTPSSSPLCKLWTEHLEKHGSVTSGHPSNWPADVYTLQGHINAVSSVAYSPDGRHIVSGSWDNTIRVWNATTGQCVAGPFQGHTREVNSVAYSPDGRHIVSGSIDKTIRVWDATTGQCVTGPFQGHTHWVNSVVYSPDGRNIVSGSYDNTIRVWDATTGQCVTGPFQGHTETVFSVAYSPDGRHIVSGSDDKTIRIWDATTGQCVAGPFQGDTHRIRSVAYSPDSRHIASGSVDKSIKVWKVEALFSFDTLYEKDGWIQSSDGTCFEWIPPWNRAACYLPTNSLVITSDKVLQVDFDSSYCGESWISCWK